MLTISIAPFRRSVSVPHKTTLLDAIQEAYIPIDAVCAGTGSCGKCKIIIENQESVTPITEKERKLLTDSEICRGMRLACLTQAVEDVVVFVPQCSIRTSMRILSEGLHAKYQMDPVVTRRCIRLGVPALGDHSTYTNMIGNALGIRSCRIDYRTLKKVPDVVRSSDFEIAATSRRSEIIGLSPAKGAGRLYGLAIDIGTTSVVVYMMDLESGKLVDVESCLNPQISYGEDVISRISSSVKYGVRELKRPVIDGINSMISSLCNRAGCEKSDIVEAAVVGNTAMHHIFLGIPPESISLSPFTPTVTVPLDIKARDLHIGINESAYVHVLPVIAGFVGADTLGVLLSTDIYSEDRLALALDIGTNGEILLGNCDGVVSCSCAAGPALEGCAIKHGMRASKGAIESVYIDPSTYEPEYRTIGDLRPKGLCGSAIVDAVSQMYGADIINENGSFNGCDSDRVRKSPEGYWEYVLEWGKNTCMNDDIVITANDVGELQLAKGAIQTGIVAMMEKRNVTFDDIDVFYLAGAFGNYIDIKNAIGIGLLPDIPIEKYSSVGNAAGEGAKASLLSQTKRTEEALVSRSVDYIELASLSGFNEMFCESLLFPEKG